MASAAGDALTTKPSPDAPPSATPAAGPESLTLAGNRPVSGKNLSAGPQWEQDASKVWQVDRTMAVLKNTVTDADGDMANLTFKVHNVNADGTVGAQLMIPGEDYGVLVSRMVASGGTAQVTVPAKALAPGKTYAFATSGYDATGLYETTWSAYSKFHVRSRIVDIKLPAPNKDAPNPQHDATWQPVPGWQSYEKPSSQARPTAPAASERRHCQPAGAQSTKQLCIGSRPVTEADWARIEQARTAQRVTRAAGPLNPNCETGGKYLSIFTRDAACMYHIWSVEVTDQTGQESSGYQEFFTAYHMKTSMTGNEMQLWSRIRPLPVEVGKVPFPAIPGAIKLTLVPQCSTGCSEKPYYSWDGNLMWNGSGDIDPHEETGTTTVKWDGKVSGAEKWDSERSTKMAFAPYATFSTSVPEAMPTGESQGLIGGPIWVRCDTVYSAAGCVFPDYLPGYAFNTAKTPAAAANAWLIDTKLRKGKPLQFLPDRYTGGVHGERNKWSRDPDSNRQVICPDGWAAKYGHPDTTELSEFDPRDTASCDEFPFASTYQSGGMPERMDGANQVLSGNECVQTYATKYSDGVWRFWDDERISGPDWSEVCGRSAMSNWVNKTAGSRISSFASKFRLLDKDKYWVKVTGFEKCDATKTVIKCDIR
ncbi:hypothetical protein [Streptomyces buecherae]|uniref:Uncharacterized protein n=1 Tax=Streptomyces buecherae TaxID=2763006 RepID=A0A7H8NAP3_9ACTN|nr:hypothetical protein [Streptomyces buecherae]QKW51491.1 hypothetical protein HUT08_20330 [Streptomyces buecherae]